MRLFINSLPKAGTHLVEKAVGLLTGAEPLGVWLGSFTAAQFAGDGPRVCIGVDWPREVALDAVEQFIASLAPGSVLTGHVPFDPALAAMLVRHHVGVVLCLRDLADVVVSHAEYVAATPAHFLFDHYAGQPLERRITMSIDGVGVMPDIGVRARSVAGWAAAGATVIRFEDLIGTRGGGTDAAQALAIAALARVAAPVAAARSFTPPDITEVARQLFGGTSTFRKGQIGQGRQSLTPAQRDRLAQLAGDVRP